MHGTRGQSDLYRAMLQNQKNLNCNLGEDSRYQPVSVKIGLNILPLHPKLYI